MILTYHVPFIDLHKMVLFVSNVSCVLSKYVHVGTDYLPLYLATKGSIVLIQLKWVLPTIMVPQNG